MNSIIEKSLTEAAVVLSEFSSNSGNLESIGKGADMMSRAIGAGRKIIACGNGGSLCDATHFCEELTSRFRESRRSLPAIAVNDSAFLTCTINDFDADSIFSRYVSGVGLGGDVLLAISTSGNSVNVLKAADAAHEIGMGVVALTGRDGGVLAGRSDVEIRAPNSKYSDRIQEIHIKVLHILVECIEARVLYN